MHYPMTILIIENDPISLKQISDLVRYIMPMARILTAGNGAYGLFIAWQVHPELILIDLDTPELDGVETVRALHRARSSCRIPVIGVSTADAEDVRITPFKKLCQTYLSKPFSLAELRDQIGSLIQVERPIQYIEAIP